MRRSARNQVLRMRLDDVCNRSMSGRIGCHEVADIFGVSLSTFYRLSRPPTHHVQ